MSTLVGVVGGSNLYGTPLLAGGRKRVVKNEYGNADLYTSGRVAFIPRHGSLRNIPPHKINHRANMKAFHDIGVSKIIGLCMTGSLKKQIKPPSILIPHDYVGFWNIPTFFDSRIVHITPMLDGELRRHILSAAGKCKIKVHEKGVYVQTPGSRLETESEIRILKDYGDVVGMTMASEATLAQELGLGYAAICTVDNYANGISKSPLDFSNILKDSALQSGNVVRLLAAAVEGLK